jgi:DNA-directed RNA polymerase specialized sigma24 family protein
MAQMLREFGLTNEVIAQRLGLPIEEVKKA